jgi:hypothetical protein
MGALATARLGFRLSVYMLKQFWLFFFYLYKAHTAHLVPHTLLDEEVARLDPVEPALRFFRTQSG